MGCTTSLRWMALTVLASALTGCAAIFGPSYPDDPGLYAVKTDGKFQRLDGDAEWERKTWLERSNLEPDVRFIVVNPSLTDDTAPLANKIRLVKVGWLRSEIGSGGKIGPVEGTTWVAPEIEGFEVPLGYGHIDRRPDLVEAVPYQHTLEPGLYSLQLQTGAVNASARLGVDWANVDRKQYAVANCIDRYLEEQITYRPCSEQKVAMLPEGLQIHLVEPEKQVVDGKPTLVIKGVILNVSDGPRRVPMLQGRLRDEAGQTLHTWQFPPPVDEVSPGTSTSFRTVVSDVPNATANVFVSFAP